MRSLDRPLPVLVTMWVVALMVASPGAGEPAPNAAGDPASPGVETSDAVGPGDAEIRARAGDRFRVRAAELVDTVVDRESALRAVVEIAQTRQQLMDELAATRRMTDMPNITLADAIDDSLANHAGTILVRYIDVVPERKLSPGAEKFMAGLSQLGFVREYVTGFLFHLELQQAFHLLKEFRQKRSLDESEDAEDAFLRHFAQLAQLYRVQHVEFRDMHLCNLANMDWAVGRFESESGTNDFYVASQFFSSRDTGFSYFLKLASPTTGETADVFYPLPHLTNMDEGWQQQQAEKAAETK